MNVSCTIFNLSVQYKLEAFSEENVRRILWQLLVAPKFTLLV